MHVVKVVVCKVVVRVSKTCCKSVVVLLIVIDCRKVIENALVECVRSRIVLGIAEVELTLVGWGWTVVFGRMALRLRYIMLRSCHCLHGFGHCLAFWLRRWAIA